MDNLSNQYYKKIILNNVIDDYSEKCCEFFKYTPMKKNRFFKVTIMLFSRSECSHFLSRGISELIELLTL